MSTLTHNMRKRRDGVWECVVCKREGTIAEINDVSCPKPAKGNKAVLDAIEGRGQFGKGNL